MTSPVTTSRMQHSSNVLIDIHNEFLLLFYCCVLLEIKLTTYYYYYTDDVIKWKHFPRYWPFVRGIHRSPVTSPHKGQWRIALMFSLICLWIKGWVNNRKAGDLRRYRSHYDVIIMGGQMTDGLSMLNSSLLVKHIWYSHCPYHEYARHQHCHGCYNFGISCGNMNRVSNV